MDLNATNMNFLVLHGPAEFLPRNRRCRWDVFPGWWSSAWSVRGFPAWYSAVGCRCRIRMCSTMWCVVLDPEVGFPYGFSMGICKCLEGVFLDWRLGSVPQLCIPKSWSHPHICHLFGHLPRANIGRAAVNSWPLFVSGTWWCLGSFQWGSHSEGKGCWTVGIDQWIMVPLV